MNRYTQSEVRAKKRDNDLKLARFCGNVAMAQYEDDKDGVNEQPTPSDMYQCEPWPLVQENPRTVVGRLAMCQMGMKASEGEYVKKRTDV